MRIGIVIAFLCGIAAYNLRFFLWEDAFYHLISLEFVLLYWIIWKNATGVWRYITQAMLLTCLNSLADEIFFDPTYVGLNEYIGFILIIVLTLIFYLKNEILSKRLGN